MNKFTYSVIGRNTKKNIEWLEKLGYKLDCKVLDAILWTNPDGTATSYESILIDKESVNCLHSDDLFRAVSAIREDSDYLQWFVSRDYGEDWMLSLQKKVDTTNTDWKKATLIELQEHFK